MLNHSHVLSVEEILQIACTSRKRDMVRIGGAAPCVEDGPNIRGIIIVKKRSRSKCMKRNVYAMQFVDRPLIRATIIKIQLAGVFSHGVKLCPKSVFIVKVHFYCNLDDRIMRYINSSGAVFLVKVKNHLPIPLIQPLPRVRGTDRVDLSELLHGYQEKVSSFK